MLKACFFLRITILERYLGCVFFFFSGVLCRPLSLPGHHMKLVSVVQYSFPKISPSNFSSIWRFPKIGVPQLSSILVVFPLQTIQLLGQAHDHGNPHFFVNVSRISLGNISGGPGRYIEVRGAPQCERDQEEQYPEPEVSN